MWGGFPENLFYLFEHSARKTLDCTLGEDISMFCANHHILNPHYLNDNNTNNKNKNNNKKNNNNNNK